MKTMKALTLFFLLSLGFFCKSANAQMYIVTEKMCQGNTTPNTYSDTVFVTTPAGVTTKNVITSIKVSIIGHDSQLNTIFNSIINLGYKSFYIYDYGTISPFALNATAISYYFAKP